MPSSKSGGPNMNKQVLDFLTKLDSKVDKLHDRLDTVDKTLIKQELNLDNHIRRTNIAEENIELVRKEIVPIKKHVLMVEGAFKIMGLLASVALGILGAVSSILKLITYFQS